MSSSLRRVLGESKYLDLIRMNVSLADAYLLEDVVQAGTPKSYSGVTQAYCVTVPDTLDVAKAGV